MEHRYPLTMIRTRLPLVIACYVWLMTSTLSGIAQTTMSVESHTPMAAAGRATMLVKGRVTDLADGSPLIGANVLIKSTNTGTITDADGNFSLEVAPGTTLIISYIGYISKEVAIGTSSFLEVTLEYNATALTEVVVVGFGVQRKENLSGAVEAVDSKVLENRPAVTVTQLLQGVVPNLNIDFVSGEPGATPNISIRGVSSINGGSPLIIVDDVPVDAAQLNYISPADIKSVSVLKDASSAAIYGARAASGVILITTKSGEHDGISINYGNNFSWSKPTVLPDKITAH